MKTSLTRRDFLKYSAVTGAAVSAAAMLAGCGDEKVDEKPVNTSEAAQEVVKDLAQDEVLHIKEEVDETRRTTANTPGELYPLLVMPLTQNVTDLDITNWWKKGDVSQVMFEQLGDDDKASNWPIWVLCKEYTEVGDIWAKFTYEKDETGAESKFAESMTECKEGDEGARHILVCDVELYDYIHDWDNNPIKAEDAVWSYRRCVLSGNALKYQSFVWCEVKDEYTVRFYMDYKQMQSLGPVEFPFCKTCIFSKAGDEAGNYTTDPVATGPYRLADYISGSKIVLEKYDDYWQTNEELIPTTRKGYVQTIEWPIIQEREQLVVALETRKISWCNSVQTEDLPLFTEGGEYAEYYNVMRLPACSTEFLCINCYEGHPGNNKDFRLAVCYAINTEAVATGAGSSYFALKGPGTFGATDYDTAMDNDTNCQTVYDPELAKEHLQKAKDAGVYNDEKLVIMCGTDAAVKNAAQVIQGLLLNVGINTEIQSLDSNITNAYTPDPSRWDLSLLASSGKSAGPMISGLNRTLSGSDFDTVPYIGYTDAVGFQNDPKILELFNQANSQTGYGKENTGKLLQHIVDNAYFKFLYGNYTNIVYTKDIAELAYRFEGEPCLQASTFYLDDIIGIAQ